VVEATGQKGLDGASEDGTAAPTDGGTDGNNGTVSTGGSPGEDGLPGGHGGAGGAGGVGGVGGLGGLGGAPGLAGMGGQGGVAGHGGAGVLITGSGNVVWNEGQIRGGNAGGAGANAGAGIRVESGAVVSHIHNLGTIAGGTGLHSVGIHNNGGQIALLSNRQAGLSYRGAAPERYELVVQGSVNGQYGTLVVQDSPNWGIGAMSFGVTADSVLADQTTYDNVIQASGSTTFDNTAAKSGRLASSQGLYRYNLAFDGQHWDLSAERVYFTASALAERNTPASAAAQVLDANPALGALFPTVSSEAELSDAATQTMPLLTGGSMALTQATMNEVARVVQGRVAAVRGLASGNGFVSNGHMWLKPFGSWADQKGRDGVAGFDASASGLAVGVDGDYSDRTRLGLSLSAAQVQSNSLSTLAPQQAKVAMYQLLGYGSYSVREDLEFDFQLGLGQNKVKGVRQIALAGLSAASAYDAVVASASAGLTHRMALGEATRLLPSVRADYTRVRDAAYTETGAAALSLAVASRTAEQLVLSAGGTLEHNLGQGTTLSANGSIGYDALSQRASTTAAFAGAPGAAFTTQGIKPGAWVTRIGLGLSKQLSGGSEISARYDAEHRKGFLNQTASVKIGWKF
jgi:uncharacterized protein with beta-barrel porin domain